LVVLLGTTFYVVRVEPFPAAYGLVGYSIPVQSLVALVVVLLAVAAVYNQTYPFFLQYFERW
jgi:hypothetical protein